MARIQIFYKGRRKRRNYLFIPFVVLLALISVLMVTFYGLQKYAVITDDSVSVELPILSDENTVVDSQGHEIVSFDPVNVSIVFDEPDYTDVEAVAGENVPPMRAIFVPYTDLNHDKLMEYANRLNDGNALLLEMKPRSGQLMWRTKWEVYTRRQSISRKPSMANSRKWAILRMVCSGTGSMCTLFNTSLTAWVMAWLRNEDSAPVCRELRKI